jgi:hypothetical protein
MSWSRIVSDNILFRSCIRTFSLCSCSRSLPSCSFCIPLSCVMFFQYTTSPVSDTIRAVNSSVRSLCSASIRRPASSICLPAFALDRACSYVSRSRFFCNSTVLELASLVLCSIVSMSLVCVSISRNNRSVSLAASVSASSRRVVWSLSRLASSDSFTFTARV